MYYSIRRFATSTRMTALSAANILGLSPEIVLSRKVVKDAWRQKAKQTHPDTQTDSDAATSFNTDISSNTANPPSNTATPSGVAASSFGEVGEARDVLLELLKVRGTINSPSGTISSLHNAGVLARPTSVVEGYAEFADFMADVGRGEMEELLRTREGNLRSPGRRMRGEGLTGTSNDGDLTKRIGIGRELRAGLDRAYYGPRVTPEVEKGEVWPYAFEVERRNLGKLPPTSHLDGEGCLVAGGTSFSNVLEIVVGRQMLGSVRRRVGEREGKDGLDLVYGDGVRARARRWRVEDKEVGGYTYMIDVVDSRSKLIARVKDDGGERPGLLGNVFGTLKGRKRDVSVIMGEDGVETHRIVHVRTPGVETGTIFRTNEGGTKGRVEGKLIKPTLPPSEVWPWSPRNASHDLGGWTVERTDGGRFERQVGKRDVDYDKPMANWKEGGLRPEVIVMLCGFMALESERRDGHNIYIE